jgi:outer membrane protein OmpA-like peptidoglycan-associated protein
VSANGSNWKGVLVEAARAILPLALTAGSFLGFVALAGGAIVWTRFYFAQLPAEQAVTALPQGELIAIGSVLLLVFGLLGALAALLIYLVDRSGRPTPGMSIGLLGLLLVEGMVVCGLLVEDAAWDRQALAAELFALAVILGGLVTRVPEFAALKDDLHGRPGEEISMRREEDFQPYEIDSGRPLVRLVVDIVALTAALTIFGFLIVSLAWPSEVWAFLAGFGAVVLGVLILGLMTRRAIVNGWPRYEVLRRDARHHRAKPVRFQLTPMGELAMLLLALIAIAGPSLVLWEWWVGGALAVAIGLGLALWRISNLNSHRNHDRFLWYGVAVFFSVPLFGTVAGILMNIADPQVQPMALIRTTDGLDEAVQGIYVTETDERVYFGSVATKGCGKDLVDDSGRLLWVPRSEVVAMAVGPLQDIDDANASAHEMFAALTPAGDRGAPGMELSVGGSPADGEKDQATSTRRLEDAGSAVRGEFGWGITASHQVASPGDLVKLTLGEPWHDDEKRKGFGSDPDGRVVHIGQTAVTDFRHWSDNEIVFRVPPGTAAGPVTVECQQHAVVPPVLLVTKKPKARISVRLRPGSDEVVFDSRRSSDDGRIVNRAWTVEGRRHTRRSRMSVSLAPRRAVYSVELRVTDADGSIDTARIDLLRLAAPTFDFAADEPADSAAVERLRAALLRRTRAQMPEAIELHGHADDVGSDELNDDLSRRRARRIRDALLNVHAAEEAPKAGPRAVPMTILAFGEGCPVDRRGGRQPRNRRVDVFVLDAGVVVDPPQDCHARSYDGARWRPFEQSQR